MGGCLFLNKRSLQAICSQQSGIFHGGCSRAAAALLLAPALLHLVPATCSARQRELRWRRHKHCLWHFTWPAAPHFLIFRASPTLFKEGGERRFKEEKPHTVPLRRCYCATTAVQTVWPGRRLIQTSGCVEEAVIMILHLRPPVR